MFSISESSVANAHHRCSVCGHARTANRRLVSSFRAYICAHCLAEASQHAPASGFAGTCAFCDTPDVVIAAAWADFSLCHECLSLGHRVIADDNRLIAEAT